MILRSCTCSLSWCDCYLSYPHVASISYVLYHFNKTAYHVPAFASSALFFKEMCAVERRAALLAMHSPGLFRLNYRVNAFSKSPGQDLKFVEGEFLFEIKTRPLLTASG